MGWHRISMSLNCSPKEFVHSHDTWASHLLLPTCVLYMQKTKPSPASSRAWEGKATEWLHLEAKLFEIVD